MRKVIIALVFALFFACSSRLDEESANRIFQKFYEDKGPEEMLDRHLLDAGKDIVPFLVKEIQRKDMPRRSYAILAIGKLEDKRAIPALVSIFEDRTESEQIRGDSLSVILRLDESIGMKLASEHAGESKYIDRTIELYRKGLI